MQIRDDPDNGEDTQSEFFTPQHVPSTIVSTSNINASQDSVDVFHDAHSLSSINLDRRRRHASTPNHTNGHVNIPNGTSSDIVPEVPLTEGQRRRVRHASYSICKQSSPNPNGRLSMSTNSLRRNIPDLMSLPLNGSPSDSLVKIPPPPSANKFSPLKLRNYVQCQEIESDTFKNTLSPVIETKDSSSPSNSLGSKINLQEKRSPPGAWMRNYVVCVETENILRDLQKDQFCDEENFSEETRLHEDDPAKNENRAMIEMYTFGNVPRRRTSKLREEFSLSYLTLEHKVPHLFALSQWQQPNRLSCLYLGYRMFWALYFLMWGIWSFHGSFGYDALMSVKVHYFTYMTNWALWTLIFDTNLQLLNVILHFRKLATEGNFRYPRMKKLLKMSWVLSNITSSVHLYVTAAYWITVYPKADGEFVSLLQTEDQKITVISLNTHLITSIYILMDAAISATPRRVVHAYQPMAFIFLYYMFNLTYFLAGGVDYKGNPYLYPALNWTKPGKTVPLMLTSILLVIPCFHQLICVFYALRIKLWRVSKISRYTREEDVDEDVKTRNIDQIV